MVIKKLKIKLSKLYAKKKGWIPAAEVIENILKENEEWNAKYSHGARCEHCGCTDLTTQYSGGEGHIDGLFTYGTITPKRFYKCTKCGHMQKSNGSYYKSTTMRYSDLPDNIEIERINKDKIYRYKLPGEDTAEVLLYIFGVIAFMVFLFLGMSKLMG